MLALCTSQDTRELRLNNWIERRQVEGPKTISQIHMDAQQEAMRQKALASDMPRGGGGRDRRDFGQRPTIFPGCAPVALRFLACGTS